MLNFECEMYGIGRRLMLEMITRIKNKNQSKIKKITSLRDNNMKYYIINGILLSIVTSLYKPYAQKFLDRLGGTETDMTMFNALPGLVAVFTIIPGILLINKAKNKKNIIASSFFISRLFILAMAFVPFMPNFYQPIAFILISSFMNFPDAVSQTSLQSFTADIFDGEDCAIAITDKNKFSSFTNLIFLIPLGMVMRALGKTNEKSIFIYQIAFVIAFLISIFEIKSFYKLKPIKYIKPVQINLKESLKEIAKNKRFIVFMLCSMTFHFGWQMGWPLFNIYQIKYMKADEMWLTISGVTSGIVMVISFGYWKRLIIDKGNAFTIAFSTTGMAVTPILFAISPNLYVLTAMGLITGFFTAGTITVILSSLLEVTTEKNRDMYVAIHATLTSITLAISPFIGNFISSHSSIYIALLATAFFRFLGSFAFIYRNKKII
jgi:predicted MFS family arabinose efflux permease